MIAHSSPRRLRHPSRVTGFLALLVATLLAATGLAQPSVAEESGESYPFRDPSLSVAARVADLLGRLTLDEKIAMLHQYQPAIPRLGIAPFKTGTEALHGLAWSTDRNNGGAVVTAEATVFPQAIGLGSTWDADLLERVGTAVGKEARGYNALDPDVWGLNLWAPVVDPLRDPRAGRNEEGYSEDAFLTGTMATSYAGGMRGDHPTYLMTAPTLKHYVGYNNEVRRDTTSADLRPRLLHEYYDVPFKMPIQAETATGVMTSYNLVNGRPATVDPALNERVRSWTDETLFNVTDAWAPHNVIGSQDYYDTLAEADAATLKAGVDSFTTDNTDSGPTVQAVRSALDQGLITEADVDRAVRHALTIRVRLGEFDPDGGPYGGLGADAVGTAEHRALAREAAGEAMVLLDNDGTLPLDSDTDRTVAVVGPLADTLYTDWYSGALPYEVTPADGVREHLGDGATVRVSEGVDRIALREVGSGKYVTGGTGPEGAVLAVDGDAAGEEAQFDVFEWGEGIVTLRNAANDKYVGYHWGPFRNDQAQPNGWFVQQQFKLEEQADGTYVVRYAGYETAYDWFGPNKYLTVAEDGTIALGASSAEQAARFEKEVVRDGLAEAQQAAEGADAVVVVVGSMPFINGREDHDRTSLDLAQAQRRLVEGVADTNPRTVMVLENSYPTTIGWARDTVPAVLWTSHAGQETGNALADVLFGDHNPAGRLTQTWYASDNDLPDITDYDILRNGTTYQYYEGDPLYAFGHGLSYTAFEYSGIRLSSTTLKGRPVTVSVDVTNTGDRAGDEVVQLYTRQRTSRDPQPVRSLRGFERVTLEPGETRTVRFVLRPADLAHWDVTRGRWVVETSAEDLMVGAASDDIRARATLLVDGETIPPRDLRGMVRAVDFDDYAGVRLVDEAKSGGDAVGLDAGDWLLYRDAALSGGVRTFTAQVARAAAGGTTLQVRLDDPVTGPLVGTAHVPSTGGGYSYTTVRASVAGAAGRREVYLVPTGDLRIGRFSIR
ncbi:MAG: glycoside hydrolase family 3 C-terminal domain-containing protein [Actinomycetota bacterium]|nr:glycoside hydrolase family 3 C-terminal domain-containing protein [Actinomycetota bacterium]